MNSIGMSEFLHFSILIINSLMQSPMFEGDAYTLCGGHSVGYLLISRLISHLNG